MLSLLISAPFSLKFMDLEYNTLYGNSFVDTWIDHHIYMSLLDSL